MKATKFNTIWLQGVGYHFGKPAGEIKIGDELVWNYGYVTVVTAIIRESAKQIVISERYEGKDYERRLKKTRIVAIKGMGISTPCHPPQISYNSKYQRKTNRARQ